MLLTILHTIIDTMLYNIINPFISNELKSYVERIFGFI